MLIWHRPAHIPFGQVWHSFIAPDLSGKMVRYEIRDLPPERYEEACKLMIENYIPDEPIAKTLNLKDEPESIKEYGGLWKSAFDQGISVGCFIGDELVAVNFLAVHSKEDPKENKEFKGRGFRYTIELYLWVLDQFVMFEEFNTNTYLLGYSMGVHRSYRKRGIATQFLSGRRPMLKALGITHTATLFTANGTQKAAENAGFTTFYQIKYSDLCKMGYPLENVGVEYAKLQGCAA